MIRKTAAAVALTLMFGVPAFGQGLFDSVLGPGGLGLWGGSSGYEQQMLNQFNSPSFYGGMNQGQSNYTSPQQVPQGYQGQAPAYGQGYPPPATSPYQGYGGQQGVYPDWYSYQPGAVAQPQPATAAPPGPVRYTAPPPQPAQPPVQEPQPPAEQARVMPQPGEIEAEDLPPGAVHITTITPSGTTVQYYPPAGALPVQPQAQVQQQPQPNRNVRRRTEQKPRINARRGNAGRTTSRESGASDSTVAMPQPVRLPQQMDPRMGWDTGNRTSRLPQ